MPRCQSSVIPCRSFALRGHRIASSVARRGQSNESTTIPLRLSYPIRPTKRSSAHAATASLHSTAVWSDPPERARQTTGSKGSTAPFPSKSANPDAELDPGLQEQEKRRPPSCITHHPASRLHCIIPAPKQPCVLHTPHSITIITQFCRLLNCCARRTELCLEPRYDGTHPLVIGPRHEGHSTVDIFAANRDVRPPVCHTSHFPVILILSRAPLLIASACAAAAAAAGVWG